MVFNQTLPRWVLFGALCWTLLVTGCAGLAPTTMAVDATGAEALQLLHSVDRAIAAADVDSAAASAVPGRPWLRVDRLQQALLPLAIQPEQQRAWLSRSYRLARQTRARELRNLPDTPLQRLLTQLSPDLAITNRVQLQTAVVLATEKLFTQNSPSPEWWAALRDDVQVPDVYAGWMRWFGYPLAAIPVKLLGDAVFANFVDWHARDEQALTNSDPLIRYQPVANASPVDLSSLPRDELGLLALTGTELAALATRFAPTLLQRTVSTDDRIGSLEWHGSELQVATDRPTGYYYLSHALIGEQLYPQLNYVFWYPARSGATAPLIERGRFDGLTIRITFDRDGKIIMTDIMNNCGCYHFFLPVAKDLVDSSAVIGIHPLTPRLFPDNAGNRLPALRILPGWHQVEYLLEQPPAQLETSHDYQLRPYAELESLPRADGTYASAFDDDGILKGSERIEPYLLFAMGIPEVGAMRQRGNHPITLIGREHFDNPRLFERYFDFKPRLSPREILAR